MRPRKKKQLKTRVKISALADLSKCNNMYLPKIINNKATPSDDLADRLAECANKLYGEDVFDQVINDLCHHIAKELETSFMSVYKVLLCLEQATNEQKREIVKLIKAKRLTDEV